MRPHPRSRCARASARSRLGAFLAACALSALSPRPCSAAVHEYRGERFTPSADAYVFRGGREGLYASTARDAIPYLSSWNTPAPGIANGESYIRFSRVRFDRPSALAERHAGEGNDATGVVQAVVFELGDVDRVGFADESTGATRYCCTPEVADRLACVPGRVVVRPGNGGDPAEDDEEKKKPAAGSGSGSDSDSAPSAGSATSRLSTPLVIDVFFSGDDQYVRQLDEAIRIDRAGMYYLWFFACDAELGESVSVTGRTTWKNPGGYLPGMLQNQLPFYGLMATAYLALGALWTLAMLAHWRELMVLHRCVAAVIAVSMVEYATWYFDFVNFNATGFRPPFATLVAVLLGSARKAASRTLVLIVSMGYGVVRPTLGGLTRDVAATCAAYFVASAALDVEANLGRVDDMTSAARVFLVLPVAFLDAVYVLWVFTALSRTLAQLEARRQTAKLDLYRKFTNALAVSVVASVAWMAYETWFRVTDAVNEKWEVDWVTNAFWHCLGFALTAAVCFLWRPSQDGTRFAYAELSKDERAEEEDGGESGGGVGGGGRGRGGANRGGVAMGAMPKGKSVLVGTPGKGVAIGQTPVRTDAFAVDDDDSDVEAKLE